MVDDYDYEWNDKKAAANLHKHGVAFESVASFDWDTALLRDDDDHDELRYKALGMIGSVLHALVYTERGSRCRVISLRRANPKERSLYHG
ncbi:MAG: BrnT family toxin [Proteobacteria bacterium]|nr:BrnT family toxin [Pseudomonadota bacterium]